jgi:hypothetical protein
MIYDATCLQRIRSGGLSRVWRAGGGLYRILGRFDRVFGASSWGEALDWLGTAGAPARIAEIQFWGHGKWGAPRIGSEVLDRLSLLTGRPLNAQLRAVRDRLVPGGESLWWFRACETFGAVPGQDFARAFTEFLGCRAAGHTHVIAFFQSGLHSLGPGETHNLGSGDSWLIQFHRGGDFGNAEYTIADGVHAFKAAELGWELQRVSLPDFP